MSVNAQRYKCDFKGCFKISETHCLACKSAHYCSTEHQHLSLKDHEKICKIIQRVEMGTNTPVPLLKNREISTQAQRFESELTPSTLKIQLQEPADPLLERVKSFNTYGEGQVTVSKNGKKYQIFFNVLPQNFGFSHAPKSNILILVEHGFSKSFVMKIKECFLEEFTLSVFAHPKQDSKHSTKKPSNTSQKKNLLDPLVEQVRELYITGEKGKVIVSENGKKYGVLFDPLKRGFEVRGNIAAAHIFILTQPGYSRKVIGKIKNCFPENLICALTTENLAKKFFSKYFHV